MDDDWGAEAAQVWNAEAGRNINMTGFFIKKTIQLQDQSNQSIK